MRQAILAERKRDRNGNTTTQARSRQFKTSWQQATSPRWSKLAQAAAVACRIMSRSGKTSALYQALDAGPGEDGSEIFAPVPGVPSDQIRDETHLAGGFEVTRSSVGAFLVRAGSWNVTWTADEVRKATTELDPEGWPVKEAK